MLHVFQVYSQVKNWGQGLSFSAVESSKMMVPKFGGFLIAEWTKSLCCLIDSSF